MVPAYGDGRLLREAVASVLAQDSPHWRLTVIDDRVDPGGGARDGDLAGELAGLGDARVRYLRNQHNLGINRNFQRCLTEAGAELVVILGSDDRLLPDYVRTVTRAAAAHPGAAWIHPGVRVIDGQGRNTLPLADRIKQVMRSRLQVGGCAEIGGERLTASLLAGNWMYFPSVAFRREIARGYGFRTGYDVVLDLDLYVRMLLDGHRAVLLDHVCFEYRRHAASLSSAEAVSGARFDEELRYFVEIRRATLAAGWRRAARAAGLHATSRLHALALAPAALRTGDRRLVARLVRHVAGPTR